MVDAIEVEIQLVGQGLSGHRLARPACPGEERGDAQTTRQPRAEPIAVVDSRTVPGLVSNLRQHALSVLRELHVVQAYLGGDALGKPLQPGAAARTVSRPELFPGQLLAGYLDGLADFADIQVELARQAVGPIVGRVTENLEPQVP